MNAIVLFYGHGESLKRRNLNYARTQSANAAHYQPVARGCNGNL